MGGVGSVAEKVLKYPAPEGLVIGTVGIESPCSHDHGTNKKDLLREPHFGGSLEQWGKATTHKATNAPEQGFPP
jgi:hypothetical protein